MIHNLTLVLSEMPKMYCNCSVWGLFTYICQQLSSVRLQKFVVPHFSITKFVVYAFLDNKVCSVAFFRLQNFVVFTCLDYKSLQCALFRLQKFVVCAFLDYKSLQCPLFQTTKVCSVRFFRLQKLVVSAFSDYKCFYCYLVMSLILCRYMGILFNVSKKLKPSSHPSLYLPKNCSQD